MEEATRNLPGWLVGLLAPLLLALLAALAVLAGLLWYVLAGVSGTWQLFQKDRSWR